jgi:glycosyltransferase 2 family protein
VLDTLDMASGESEVADRTAVDQRVRSPADVLRMAVAAFLLLVLLVVQWLFGDTLVVFMSQLLGGLAAIPDWILDALVVGSRLLALAVLAYLLLRVGLRHRWQAFSAMLCAGVLAAALVVLLDGVAQVDSGETVVPDLDLGPLSAGWFPSAAGVAVLAALLTATAPWTSRRWRRMGWVAVVGLTLVRFLASAVSFDSLRAVLIGWLAGGATLVALGAPLRRPTAETISAGLAAVGLPLASITPASVDARGSTPYFAVGADGGKLFVKALGRDERSADLLFRVYRWAQRRDLGDERPFSSLRRAVEHEAFLSLAARDLGIPTPRFRALATADPGAFVIAYDAVDGRSLDRVPLEQMTDDVLAAIWEQLGVLRAHRIAHRDLRLANLFLGADSSVLIIDFGFSEIAASDLLLANDVAEFVASSSIVVGAERAVAPALASVDAATLALAAERLRPWSLSGATRTAMSERTGLLDDLARRLR